MAKEQLSDKQQQILEFIKRRILDKGYPPAVREICEAVNLRSTSSVHSHLETLERKGYIHRDPTKPRAIEITDDDFNLARREIINIPVPSFPPHSGLFRLMWKHPHHFRFRFLSTRPTSRQSLQVQDRYWSASSFFS